jgi:16S rRNA (uracil1498-N3)-methyltransferase
MSHRFFVEAPITGDSATLIDSEAHHLSHVMRLAVGNCATLFDGSGAEFNARVAKITRTEVVLDILAKHEIDRESASRVTLGVALPKGDRQRWLIEKAVELGVTQLVPLKTTRGVAQPNSKAILRLERAVIGASKQSGRNRLMEIAEPIDADAYFTTVPDDATAWIAHPYPSEDGSLHSNIQSNQQHGEPNASPILQPTPEYRLAVGPEGGWTDKEVTDAQSYGWKVVGLGPRILRIETAALVLAMMAVYK